MITRLGLPTFLEQGLVFLITTLPDPTRVSSARRILFKTVAQAKNNVWCLSGSGLIYPSLLIGLFPAAQDWANEEKVLFVDTTKVAGYN